MIKRINFNHLKVYLLSAITIAILIFCLFIFGLNLITRQKQMYGTATIYYQPEATTCPLVFAANSSTNWYQLRPLHYVFLNYYHQKITLPSHLKIIGENYLFIKTTNCLTIASQPAILYYQSETLLSYLWQKIMPHL